MSHPEINFPHLSQRLFNTPLALHEGKAEMVVAALADRFGLARLFRPSGEVVNLASVDLDSAAEAAWTPYQVIAGVAVIPVSGTLVQKLGTLRPFSGMTGYDGLRANISMAAEDDAVKGIVYDHDSGGGEVSGLFDLVDDVGAVDKPQWSILSESSYSAAYALASATDKIVVPRTGGTGSVGIISMHVDFSKALAEAGVDVTLIKYGKKKGAGHETQPLSTQALRDLQADVDKMGDLFVDTVARNRGLKASKVKATEAGTFMGADGVDVGFADAVMAPHVAFRAFLEELA